VYNVDLVYFIVDLDACVVFVDLGQCSIVNLRNGYRSLIVSFYLLFGSSGC
jgi:hypothetical protein